MPNGDDSPLVLNRQGVVTNIAGTVVATWRWSNGKLLFNTKEDAPEFQGELKTLQEEGAWEYVPTVTPNGVGTAVKRFPFNQITIGQADMMLKRKGYFMYDTPTPQPV